MKVGINNISIYIPPLYLSHDDLADARNIPRDKFRIGLGNINMAIVPPWDDTVTMAANAAEMAIEAAGIDKDEIGLLIVSTETGVDQSKPVASFVQGLLGIGHRTRVYEIKHACYGGTVAIMNAINWVKSQHHRGKKALVITSDIAKYGLNTLGEPTQGAGAVAFIISDETEFVHFLSDLNAFYSKDVHDFWRPNGYLTPIVDGKYSIDCYLEALDFCTKDLQDNLIRETGKKLLDFVDYFIYHLPFARMAYKAHCRLLTTLNPTLTEDQINEMYKESFEEKTKPALIGSEEVGNIYTGSVYMCLISLIEEKSKSLIDKNIGIFSYGSGCGAEFLIAHIGRGIKQQAKHLNFNKQLKRRKKITMEEYTELYSEQGASKTINQEDVISTDDEFSRYFFTGVKKHKRQYTNIRN
jgi:hydroxymethylglutaryl-CoA synthase